METSPAAPSEKTPSHKSTTPPDLGWWDVFILGISVLTLGILIYEAFGKPAADVRRALRFVDTVMCMFFLADFVKRFIAAPSKWRFMRWGWIDLLASIPMLDELRWGRALRVFRIFRALRAFRSLREIRNILFAQKERSVAATLVFMVLTLVTVSALAILELEAGHDGPIGDAEDAAWWAITTMTTVGYGDTYPVSAGGRLLGAGLMIFGISIFGALSALLTSWVLKQNEPPTDQVLQAQLSQVLAELQTTNQRLEKLEMQNPARQTTE